MFVWHSKIFGGKGVYSMGKSQNCHLKEMWSLIVKICLEHEASEITRRTYLSFRKSFRHFSNNTIAYCPYFCSYCDLHSYLNHGSAIALWKNGVALVTFHVHLEPVTVHFNWVKNWAFSYIFDRLICSVIDFSCYWSKFWWLIFVRVIIWQSDLIWFLFRFWKTVNVFRSPFKLPKANK